MNTPFCSVIIVTHDSELFLPKALKALESQTRPVDEIILVDSGSKDLSYLQKCKGKILLGGKDIGYAAANNKGFNALDSRSNYVFFLNPDAFLTPSFIEKALLYLENPLLSTVGAITGTALGYDIHFDRPRGSYDSTGIFQTWYGRWFDRKQGERVEETPSQRGVEEVPAICGALFFARREALESIQRGSQVFDERYYMYKEDIDLSLRLRALKWKLLYVPELKAYHCRGWEGRKKMGRRWRLLSARNDLRLLRHLFSLPALCYASLKYLAVKVFNV